MSILSVLKKLHKIVNCLPFLNVVSGRRRNKIVVKGLLLRTRIKVAGEGNTIVIANGALLYKSGISISGNNNYIEIGQDSHIKYASFNFEDSNNRITVGKETAMLGNINIACLEQTQIDIGEGCLFSAGIEIRTSDSHSIMSMDLERINHAESISIGDRVWCNQGVYILKGSVIGTECVIGAGSIVNKKYQESNCILAGVPAKIVKRGITWQKERI